MQFFKVEGPANLEVALISSLNSALAKNTPVLWIVAGGSNIPSVIRILDNLEIKYLQNLTLILSDERYGPIGHTDSNFVQLHQAGLAERGATFVDLLYGGTFEETVSVSNDAVKHLFSYAEEVIGFLGMGPDGHIAGILPNSAATESTDKWMVGYDGGQYHRITLTPYALSHVKTIYIGAFGEAKKPALELLRDQILPIKDQPAQILRHIPDVFIYNDQIGDA